MLNLAEEAPMIGIELWRSTLWKGDYLCRQQWKPSFILDQITLSIQTSSNKDQGIDMGIIYVDINESRQSFWTTLHGQFGSIQEHEFRGNSEFIRYRAEIDIGPSSWDSECDYDWLGNSLSGGRKQKFVSTQIPYNVQGKCRNIQKRIDNGKIK